MMSRTTLVSHASLYWSYLGETVMTLCPLLASSIGRPPTTSPRPPVLDHGATSAETKTKSSGVFGSSTSGFSDPCVDSVAAGAARAMGRGLLPLPTPAPGRRSLLRPCCLICATLAFLATGLVVAPAHRMALVLVVTI